MKTAELIPVRLSEQGLDNLTAWLKKIDMPTNLRALRAWEAEALQNASIYNGKLADCHVESGTWATKIYTLDFDLSDVVLDKSDFNEVKK